MADNQDNERYRVEIVIDGKWVAVFRNAPKDIAEGTAKRFTDDGKRCAVVPDPDGWGDIEPRPVSD